MKVDKSMFAKFKPGSDVIHDAHKVILDINLKKNPVYCKYSRKGSLRLELRIRVWSLFD